MDTSDYDRLFTNGDDILFIKNEQGDYIFRRSFNLTANADESRGSVSGSGKYRFLDTATVTATAKSGYRFSKWSDNTTENPKTISIGSSDIEITANFEKKSTPTPKPVDPTPVPYVSLYLYHDNGTVTCTPTPRDATVTWESGGESAWYHIWTHSQYDGVETVTFTGKKDGYESSTKSMRILKTTEPEYFHDTARPDYVLTNNTGNEGYYMALNSVANAKALGFISSTDHTKKYWKGEAQFISSSWGVSDRNNYKGWVAVFYKWASNYSVAKYYVV